MNKKQIKEIQRKLALPTQRDKTGMIIPTPFTDEESQFIIDVLLKPIRDKNRSELNGNGIEKHWTKMSKKERLEQ